MLETTISPDAGARSQYTNGIVDPVGATDSRHVVYQVPLLLLLALIRGRRPK